jgi:Domain of unknown function (DUF4375)
MIDSDQAIEISDNAWEKAGFDAKRLTYAVRVVHLIARLNVETILGGILGWLSNAGGYALETVAALESVGAHTAASIVREVIAFFPDGTPAFSAHERARQIMDIADLAESHWSELGDRLLAWPDDINALLQKFINEHEADFT